MTNLTPQNDNLILFIKNIILKYCPYVENRISILGKAKAPQFDINIDIKNEETQIMFLFGNNNFKQSIDEKVEISGIITFNEIKDIIDYILSDHEIVKELYIYNNKLNLNFAINWTDENLKGINCSDITIQIKFNDSNLEKDYLYLLFKTYYNYLIKVPAFKKIRDNYIYKEKESYFEKLNKNELINFLNMLNEDELRKLLLDLNNDTFIKYYDNDKEKSKVLVLTSHNDN